MKNRYLRIYFVILSVGLLCGACGGSGLAKNETLGIFPTLFFDNAQKTELLKQQKQEKIAASSTFGDINAANSTYEKEYSLLMAETSEAVGKAAKRLIGRDVPFEMRIPDSTERPLLDIVSAKITNADAATGEIIISVVVRTNYDLDGMPAFKILYKFVDIDGDSIFGWAMNPFDCVAANGSDTNSVKFSAGDIICEQGTMLKLYCRAYDYSRFSKIVFMLS